MSTLVWKKSDATVDEHVQQYMAGDDVVLDRHLMPFDIRATIAHVQGLANISALSADEASALVASLEELARQFESGAFILDYRYEDCHSAIESFVTEKLGDVGKKVHLGRSRNDQVLVAQRLFIRDALEQIRAHVIASADTCLELAQQHRDAPMPGYTHLQRAVPSTIGMWMAGFAEAFIDDADIVNMTLRWISANPLGTAAGYGVNVPLDREYTTNALGFERVLINPIYAQNSRGKHELQALSTCWQVLQDVRRLAWDLSLFSTAEFGFVRMTDAVATGSSIMPNKRNPDLAELMRAAIAPVAGAMNELQQLLSLPSGYQRDLQLTKGPIVRGLRHTLATIELTPVLLASISFDHEKMAAAIDNDMYATDRAVELAMAGAPFRDAYRQAAAELDDPATSAPRTPAASIAARVSPGACADLQLDALRKRLDASRRDR